MYSSLIGKTGKRVAALLCASVFGLFAAGCHNHNQNSGYGVAWMTLTNEPNIFASYLVEVDSVVLIGKTYGSITAIATPELVDFTKLSNISELWSAANVPSDSYIGAIITMDYTNAAISVMVNGAPVKATVVDPSGAAMTTVAVSVNFDPDNMFTLMQTQFTSNALLLAVNYDVAASTSVNMATSPPTVTVAPYLTLSTAPSDSKLIRVRGPLINSNVDIGTYTVVVRPFFDEVSSLGTLSLFNSASTVFTENGTAYVGTPGLKALSLYSAGSTISAAYTTFEATTTPIAGVTAGIFHPVYVVAGSTLEDFYTSGIEGDVIARSGNTLTLRGATLTVNVAQVVQFQNADAQLLLGPATQVTADGVATLGPLDYNSVAVGQHVIARGLYSVNAAGTTVVDATGATQTNTGSVRLISTQVFGSLTSSSSGSALMNLQAINNWPVSAYNFAGNGATSATDSNPASYAVNTGALALPVAAGDPLWFDGYTSPFGSAPPDFLAQAANAEANVPAVMEVNWTSPGTTAPFATLTDSGLSIDLTNAAFASGQIRVGAENIDITTLGASPQVVPLMPPPPASGLPATLLPLFSVGPGATTEVTTIVPIDCFNSFPEFVTQMGTTLATPTSVTKFVATGLFNRATQTFTASRISVVI
ncbi:MAG TPA: hypothetical protein VGI65_07695 [Steroidobacteraceae bacterium]